MEKFYVELNELLEKAKATDAYFRIKSILTDIPKIRINDISGGSREKTIGDPELLCPFCGNKIRIIVCDDEGNIHNDDYENDPWSGLGYMFYHDISDDPKRECPIARHEGDGVMGIHIYDTREEAIGAWNSMKGDGVSCHKQIEEVKNE